MSKLFARFAKDESGATAVEYGLLASLIALALITSVTAFRDRLIQIFTSLSTGI